MRALYILEAVSVMMVSPAVRIRFLVLLFLCISVSILHLTCFGPYGGAQRLRSLWHHPELKDLSAANSTLGFQVILSVSAENQNSTHAWRRPGLIRAANRTNLQINIPSQRDYTFKELKAIRDGKLSEEGVAKPGESQALAWLGHLDALQRVIDAQATTAFILEDDADWDVSLPDQLRDISNAVRNITNATSQPELYPYGLDWDVLWLGHCGDVFDKSDPSSVGIWDPSMLPLDQYRLVWSAPDFYKDFPPQTRLVHRSKGPMCSFAYAVTLEGAKKLKDWASSAGEEAFDVKLHRGCKTDKLVCLSVVPEVVHHQRMVGASSLSHSGGPPDEAKTADRSDIDVSPKGTSPGLNHDVDTRMPGPRMFTENILHSARCNWNRADDELIQCTPTEEEVKEYWT